MRFAQARSVQETANAEVIRALLHAHQFQQQYIRDNGIVRKREHIELLTEDRDLFATVQKDPNGLEIWDAENDEKLHEYQGRTDTLLLPAKMLTYVTMVRPEKWQFWLKGPRGPGAIDDKREAGATATEVTPVKLADHLEPQRILGNKKVYQARAFHVDGVQPLDLLSRVRQIGEYNTMFDPHCDYATGYSSKERGIMIYNEDQDKMEVIGLRAALQNCGLFDSSGNLKPLQSMDRQSRERDTRDARADFLTRPNTRESALVFGDIDETHFGRGMLNDLGTTVVDSIFSKNLERRNRLQLGITSARESFVDRDATTMTFTDHSAAFQADFKFFVNRLRSIFGTDNLFVGGSDATNVLYESFVGFGVAPVASNIGAPVTPRDPRSKKIIQATFKAIRLAAVTDADRAQLDAITSDETRTVDARMLELRDLLMSWVGRTQHPLYDNLNTQQQMSQWFNELHTDYKNLMTQHKGGAKASGLSWAAPFRLDVEYAYPEIVGQLHPMGSEDFPSALNQIPMFSQAMIAHHLQSQAGSDGTGASAYVGDGMDDGPWGGAGGGAYGIGQAAHYATERNAPSAESGVPMPENIGLVFGDFAVNPEGRFAGFGVHLGNISRGSADVLTKISAAVFLGARFTEPRLDAIISHNVLFPLNFLIMRPHATYRGRIAIKVQSYGGAGRTYYGHSDAQVAHDINIKVGKVHFTCYMAAIVDTPKNVFVQPDLYIDRYLGGLGTKFWSPESYNSMRAEDNEESIIVIAIPYAERDIPNPMDIAGRFYTDYEYGLLGQDQYEQLHYPTAFRYNNDLYNFFNRINAMDEFAVPTLDHEQPHINRICWRGHQAFYNKHSGAYDIIQTNTGHWGQDVAAGRRKVSDGKTK